MKFVILKYAIYCIVIVVLILPQSVRCQNYVTDDYITLDSLASKQYNALRGVLESFSDDTSYRSSNLQIRAMWYAKREVTFLKYRNFGMQLWKEFPNDLRKYEWLQKTISHGPYIKYWSDPNSASLSYLKRASSSTSYAASINWNGIREWNKMLPYLRAELFYYMSNDQDGVVSVDTCDVLTKELVTFFELCLNSEYRENNKMDINKLKLYLLSAANSIDEGQHSIRKWGNLFNPLDGYFISAFREYGLSISDVQDFIGSLKHCSNEKLKNWAIQRSALLSLREKPLTFVHKTIDGQEIDIEKLRGKVILLDFWATWCSSCISRMHALKEAYLKYKNRGFEVISISVNRETEREQVERIREKIGVSWPTLIIGGKNKDDATNSLAKWIWDKYGFWGVPQLLLFDKNGKLVMINDILRSGDINPLVERLLSEK